MTPTDASTALSADPPILRLAADPARAVPDPVPYRALTPNPRAAAALGVKPGSLDDLATELLRAAGTRRASELGATARCAPRWPRSPRRTIRPVRRAPGAAR